MTKTHDNLVDDFCKLEVKGFTNIRGVRRFKRNAEALLKVRQADLVKLIGSGASEDALFSMRVEVEALQEMAEFLPWGWDQLVEWYG